MSKASEWRDAKPKDFRHGELAASVTSDGLARLSKPGSDGKWYAFIIEPSDVEPLMKWLSENFK